MKKWTRAKYLPNKPLFKGMPNVTASKEHVHISKEAATEALEKGLITRKDMEKSVVRLLNMLMKLD